MGIGDGLFYFPTKHIHSRPESYAMEYESVFFESTDGARIHGWFFPGAGRTNGTVVHFHGNSGNISHHFEPVKWLPSCGWNVFCFDYRGYGRSTGQPSRQGTIDDGHAAVEFISSHNGVDSSRIVVLGQSLGGAVGIVVTAQRETIRGIVAEGAFSNYRYAAEFICKQNVLMRPASSFLSRALISSGSDPIDWVGRISPRPSFYLCGTNDGIVDYRQTAELCRSAGDPKEIWVIEGGGHVDSMCTPEGRDRVLGFLNRCLDD
jgi:uncharacterized protein